MLNRLFVYGTLAPGGPNEHILAPISGSWSAAVVKGRLLQSGWGAELGYWGMIPDEQGDDISGFVLTAECLAEYLPMLDAFEGEGYERVVVNAQLNHGVWVSAYAYRLSQSIEK